MRTRIYAPKKVVTASSEGVVRHENKVSTDRRIKQLIDVLGIDAETYKLKASIRKYTRAFELGIEY
jgi:hypothetical protein